jgi:phage-related tail fiber protein
MNRLFSALLLATSLLAATACSDNDEKDPAPAAVALPAVSGAFTGAQEVPAVATSATGTFAGTFDRATRELRFTVTFAGLTPTAGHLHTGAPGVNGPVFLPFPFNDAASTGFVSPITGTSILSPAQAAALLANGVYANLHTAARPGGEIRADLTVR